MSLLLYPESVSVISRRAPKARFQNPRRQSCSSKMEGLSLLSHTHSLRGLCLNHAIPCQVALLPGVRVSAAKGGSLWLPAGPGGGWLLPVSGQEPGLGLLPPTSVSTQASLRRGQASRPELCAWTGV